MLEIKQLPHDSQIMLLTDEMLEGTREIEKNLISKLNCMYFAARKVSMPNCDYMLRKEKELTSSTEIKDFYTNFSVQINGLINQYFSAAKGGKCTTRFNTNAIFFDVDDVEMKIAGDAHERSIMMPLLYIDPDNCESERQDVRQVLREAHANEKADAILNVANRMKPLDVVKVLMGIQSNRDCVQRFAWKSNLWTKLQEYDFEQLLQLAESEVRDYYIEALSGVTVANPNKKMKLAEEDE